MRKIVTGIMITIFLCTSIGLIGCRRTNNAQVTPIGEEPSTEAGTTDIGLPATEELATEEQTGGLDQTGNLYDEVLAQYTDMVQNNFYMQALEGDDWEAYDACFGPDIGLEIRTCERDIYYSLFDFDQNGVTELFIAACEPGSTEIPDSLWYYDMYTHDGSNVVHVFPDYDFGYRTNLFPLEGGILKVEGSYSAAEGGYEFYKIGDDGYTAELLDSFTAVYEMVGDVATPAFYQQNEVISEEEYYEQIDSYGDEIISSLDWIQIK